MIRFFAVCFVGGIAIAGAPSLGAQPPVPAAGARPDRIVVSTTSWRSTSDAGLSQASPQSAEWTIAPSQARNGEISFAFTPDLRLAPGLGVAVRVPYLGGLTTAPVPDISWRNTRAAFTERIPEIAPQVAGQMALQDIVYRMFLTGAFLDSEVAPPSTPYRWQWASAAGEVPMRIETTRHTHRLRDSIVNGRRAAIVRDSVVVTWTRQRHQPARFTGHVSITAEEMRGTIVGTRIIDRTMQHSVAAFDTAEFRGRVTGEEWGDRFTAPVFERQVRSIIRQDDQSRTAGSRTFGVLSVDANRASTSPARADSALAAGDTAGAISLSFRNLYARAPIGVEEYTVHRAVMSDALLAFRHRVEREAIAVNLIDGLLNRPPLLSTDAARGFCAPAACSMMAADARNRSSMLLHAVGLVASMVTMPDVWTDSVVHYASTNPLLAGRPSWFARGASNYATASAKKPIPAAHASWREWLDWLTARDSAYVAYVQNDPGLRDAAALMPRARSIVMSEIGATAIRFAEQRTRRGYVDALRQGRATADSDSARAVFDAILLGLGERVFSDTDLSRILSDVKHPEREPAVRQLTAKAQWTPASAAVATEVGHLAIDEFFGSVRLPRVDSARLISRFGTPLPVDSVPRYVSIDSLPESVRVRASALGFAPAPRGFTITAGSSAYHIYVGAVYTHGSFARISLRQTVVMTRSPTRSGGAANGRELILLRTSNGWVVVHETAWVT